MCCVHCTRVVPVLDKLEISSSIIFSLSLLSRVELAAKAD